MSDLVPWLRTRARCQWRSTATTTTSFATYPMQATDHSAIYLQLWRTENPCVGGSISAPGHHPAYKLQKSLFGLTNSPCLWANRLGQFAHYAMKTVRSGSHLERIGDTWYYRRVVPPDARAAFGKRTIRISLRTTSRVEAMRLGKKHDIDSSPGSRRRGQPGRMDIQEGAQNEPSDSAKRFSTRRKAGGSRTLSGHANARSG
jgi:hypothetical protein